jgi:hypothetical protein
MGSDNFFSKVASIDPLAQALDLPGAHKYAQSQAQDAAGQTDTNGGAYTGVNATLAGANAGYAPGGPGATPGFAPTQPTAGNSLFGKLQGAANLVGNSMPYRAGNGIMPTAPNNPLSTANPYVQTTNPGQSSFTAPNPYAAAAGNAVRQSSTGSY